ncbi:unnamed protein product [Orchesella dallaii]|uniref:Lipoprotein n=1 Tax=Orchesella dallaii TaxID=48710 RepID=A0ABP1PJH5_9HEXA
MKSFPFDGVALPTTYEGTLTKSIGMVHSIRFIGLVLSLSLIFMSCDGVSGDFGNVAISNNRNAKITGERNQGVVAKNSNIKLFSINCVLNLIQNSNANIKAENSKLECSKCSNVVLDGKGNTAVLSENSNSKFQGDNNQWDAKENSNLMVFGTGSILKILRNRNSKIFGDRCKVFAENNANLKVLGNDGKVSIQGTQNHELKPASMENRMDISPSSDVISISSGSGSGWISSMLSILWSSNSNGNNAKFTIDYVDEAVIDKTNYKLVDPGSFVARTVNPSEVIISATKEGVKQSLTLQGPCVKSQIGSLQIFDVDLVPNQSNM